MTDTLTKVDRRVGKALASFQKARDALAAAEAEARAEAESVRAQVEQVRRQAEQRVAELTSYCEQVDKTGADAAAICARLDEFLVH